MKVFRKIGEKIGHFISCYNFLQIAKPIKRHLNSSNLDFLYNLVFSSGFIGETARGKKTKNDQSWVDYDDITGADQWFVHENVTNCV